MPGKLDIHMFDIQKEPGVLTGMKRKSSSLEKTEKSAKPEGELALYVSSYPTNMEVIASC